MTSEHVFFYFSKQKQVDPFSEGPQCCFSQNKPLTVLPSSANNEWNSNHFVCTWTCIGKTAGDVYCFLLLALSPPFSTWRFYARYWVLHVGFLNEALQVGFLQPLKYSPAPSTPFMSRVCLQLLCFSKLDFLRFLICSSYLLPFWSEHNFWYTLYIVDRA